MSLVDYGSESDSEKESVQNPSSALVKTFSTAPTALALHNTSTFHNGTKPLSQLDILTTRRAQTRTYDVAAGPENPNESQMLTRKLGNGLKKNMLTGRIDKEAFDGATFEEGYKRYMLDNKTLDPTLNNKDNDDHDEDRWGIKRSLRKSTSAIKKKRKTKGDSSVLEGSAAYVGPWASYSTSGSSSGYSESESGDDNEDEEQSAVHEPVTIPKPDEDEDTHKKEWSEFVGSEEFDYLGRTYMNIPKDLDISLTKDAGSQECFVPKRRIHRWNGHMGGVNCLRFFPNSGHVLLSGGNDTQIKIWDCHRNNREQLRTIHGHTKAVKDLSFNNDGTKFLSAAYDRTIKLWDTETGKLIRRFKAPTSSRKNATANAVRFNPNQSDADSFVSAMSDNTILQWDSRISSKASGSSANNEEFSTEVVQTYDHHLGPVNSLTFVDENQRFMSSSDDKTLLVWDWGINVPIKYISDPAQHAMPCVSLHPSAKYVAAQSMDNRILVFGATGKFRQNRKKEFIGHQNAGYPINVAFSPDGKYLMSGDAKGYAYFWDWKTTQVKSKFKASEEVVTCIESHPQETSKVAIAGKESMISYWD